MALRSGMTRRAIWSACGWQKYEIDAFDEDAEAADRMQEYKARIAALEQLVGRQALELEFRGGSSTRTADKKRAFRDHRPRGLSVSEG